MKVVQNILTAIGVLAIMAGLLFVGFAGGVNTAYDMNTNDEMVIAQVEQGINQAQSGTQSGLAATDWKRFCEGLEGYVYDGATLPAKNPCAAGTIFVIDAAWNSTNTNDGEFFVTTDYSLVLESQKSWPNGSVWTTDTLEWVAKSLGDWCAGVAPKIIENTDTWTSCGGDFQYVVVDPWNLAGETNVGFQKTFGTIDLAIDWLDRNNLDHGSMWVQLKGYQK